MTQKKYKFFYGGIYSNFHRCKFTIDDQVFTSTEQYMMYMKALTFDDLNIAGEVLNNTDPKVIKALGRKIKGFNDEIWNQVKEDIVYKGLYAKFTQNHDLYTAMKEENCDLFVEASPSDKIWGIGLSYEKAIYTREQYWPGQNLLGKLLTKVKNNI